MKPSIGRIVHYFEFLTRPYAAIISDVTVHGEIVLHAMTPGGVRVVHGALFSEEPQVGRWCWPPRV